MKIKNNSLLLLVFSLGACQTDANFRSYVIAHRLSHDAIVGQYKHYIDSDPTLSLQDKSSFNGRIDAEELMISEAEKFLGISK